MPSSAPLKNSRTLALRARAASGLGKVFVLVAASVTAPLAAHAKPLLLVSAEAGGDIVLIDPAKPEQLERVKVGLRPRGLKLSRDGKSLLVAVAGPAKGSAAKPGAAEPAPGLAIVDLPGRKVTKHIATAPGPFAVDLTPDGRTAYVSNSDTNEVFAVDVGAGTVKKKTPLGAGPQAIAVAPGGKTVYIANHGSDEVTAVDAKAVTVSGRIDAGSRPQTVLLAPGGDKIFVIDEGLPTVTVVDAKKNTFKEQFVITGLPKTPAPALQSAVLAPNGKLIYITTGAGRSVLIVDPAKKTLVGTIDAVGAFPRGIAISPDGKKLYTANGPSNDVSIIDVASKKVEAHVAVPGAPWAIVVAR
jgi:YVTN family beta-propeller protein